MGGTSDKGVKNKNFMALFDKKIGIPEEFRGSAMTKIQENWDDLLDAQIRLAKGIFYVEKKKNKDGEFVDERIYELKPDKEAGQYLMNQGMGKPKESMNIEGKVNLIVDE